MNVKLWAIGLVVFCAFLASLGQLLFKLGSESISTNLLSWAMNLRIIGGMVIYFVGAILFIVALKHGNLSILYPLIATSYIWVVIFSTRFLGEPFSFTQWIGIALIIGGVSLTTVR